MNGVIYGALARSRQLRDFKRGFRDATRLSLKLVPKGAAGHYVHGANNSFCALMATTSAGCAVCIEVRDELERRLERKLAPQKVCCFAGMVDLAVPVVVSGRHVATLLGGQVFRKRPGPAQFERLRRQLREWGLAAELRQAKRAYFQTPVVSEKQFRGAVRLLTVFASQLAESANRLLLASHGQEPDLIIKAMTSRTEPVKIFFPAAVTEIFAVAAGSYHSLAITDDGVYTWGSNGGAQLGDGTRINRTVPVKVALPAAVTAVSAVAGGGFHSLALTNDGLYAWGNNTFGQLGNGTITDSAVPVKVVFNVPRRTAPVVVTTIAAGFWHSLAIGDGNIYGWGYGNNGELGSPSGSTNVFPVKAVFPKKTAPIIFTTVTAGDMHSLALSNAGDVYAFGNNSEGQLGTNSGGGYSPTKVPGEGGVVDISAGYSHSLALH